MSAKEGTSQAFGVFQLAMARRAALRLQAEDWAAKTQSVVEARCTEVALRDGVTEVKIEHELLPNRNAGRAEALLYLTALADVLVKRGYHVEVQGERYLYLHVSFGHFGENTAP